ncbi:tRNA lysidine(34) synthetase TilS [Methylacidimicrobium cyclopophantes]|uniref:tRNA lysidine(34) synthetase TilS n=1 Tax=Methylacidimicrobium cyclopophantes TaxID=1041766 RepID=UPI0015B4BDC9|nr:tRNA lysidine(34) synthetase TilS [Methylacidimicrobium cyclopophantes]
MQPPAPPSHLLHAILSVVEELPSRLLVGVSGGLDSCVLLDALVLSGKRPIVLHFDHGWRPESGEDAAFVGRLAASYGLPYRQEKAPSAARDSEAAARRERYDFFARASRSLGCCDLALAHHADDQVETLLLQLLRGGGTHARGMREFELRNGLRLHRPLLWIERKEMREYAKARNLSWREDRSNQDCRYLRNRVRHELIPFLEERFSRHARRALLRFCRVRIDEEEWMTGLVRQRAEEEGLSVVELRNAPVAEQRRWIHLWLRRRGVPDVSLADVESVRWLASEPRGGKQLSLGGGWKAIRSDGAISLRRKEEGEPCVSINS